MDTGESDKEENHVLPELGHFLLILAAVIAFVFPWTILYGVLKGRPAFTGLWRPAVLTVFAGLTLSLFSLAYAFLTNDFSVTYVSENSNSYLGTFYKIAAVWSSHEGSMLLWIWLISCWTTLFALLTKESEEVKAPAVASALLIIGLLSLFLVFTSNPFARQLPMVPAEGKDLNPILQDIGMIFHPPLLFWGYAGISLSFAFSIGCLLRRQLTPASLNSLTKISVIAWGFLTAGNVLGSWWAYNELGWGGWWFWDPVENSSFIPWLLASAQLHAFLLARKRHKLCKSVLFIPIAAFTVSLIGTFIVRSGVIQSVHAFASDPNKGLFLIAITVLMALPTLILFARNAVFFKGDTSEINAYDAAVSMAVMILSAAAAVVLFGTVFPLIYQGFGLGSLSVGAPYFNSIFAPLTIAAALLISGFTLFRQRAAAVAAVIAVSAASSAAIFFFLHPKEEIMTAFAVFACAMLFLSLITEALIKHVGQNWFAFLAHLGIAVSMVGVIGDTQFQQEALVRMGPGYGRPLGDFIFVYDRTDKVDSKSFYADEGRIIVLDKDEKEITELRPQRQTFKSNGMQMTHASISHGLFCDLYVSMGNQLSAEEYLMRLNIKPMMIWLWLGGLLMIFGLFFARTFRREKDLS